MKNIECNEDKEPLFAEWEKPRGGLHVDFFTYMDIKEAIFDIHLKKIAMMRVNNNQNNIDR